MTKDKTEEAKLEYARRELLALTAESQSKVTDALVKVSVLTLKTHAREYHVNEPHLRMALWHALADTFIEDGCPPEKLINVLQFHFTPMEDLFGGVDEVEREDPDEGQS